MTHDEPHTSATGKWILWDIEAVDLEGLDFDGYLTMNHLESLSSFASDEGFGSEPGTPLAAVADKSSRRQVNPIQFNSIIQLPPPNFYNANAVTYASG